MGVKLPASHRRNDVLLQAYSGYGIQASITDYKRAFARLTPHAIKGCVKVAEGKLQKIHGHLVQVNALEADEEFSVGSGSWRQN
ncbi:hypothetical protein H257_08095 [Aphanomyces astaci]|uniref:Uncharacterized protein n=1 Tax=Aphanomyces astaci TaxID=112090 RepID=W4GHV4_APHAT|nr:hypothetical protein H257_08095 [Aphanomyces astaci]ETV78599.1 hypothetical protein H257_08095 [Aphanomyces astaci]|eukprot:XP_009832180.1 hypothetical protein H257_08095 [Aphanomyces astaci]